SSKSNVNVHISRTTHTSFMSYSIVLHPLATCSLFSRQPRPPSSTLFPYNDALPIFEALVGIQYVRNDVAFERGAFRVRGDTIEIDRKSTRLNSSHLGISYAVFCLKKKKKRFCCPVRWSHRSLRQHVSVDHNNMPYGL